MIKRVFWVALYTGTSQILSLITISYIIRNLGADVGGYVGLVDATILVMSVIISFGIQFAVNRNVATRISWKSNYQLSQSARLSVGFLIAVFGGVSYIFNWDITKWILFVAPLIALNGDYALYGAGMPVKAARLSMIRVALPNLAILIGSKFIGGNALYLYMLFAGLGILNSGFWASRINEVPYLYKPSNKFVKVYFKNYKVGLWQLSHVMLISGILTVAKPFYSIAVLGLVYGILKFFEVLKGVLRIIWQAFFRELGQKGNNLRIDKAGLLIGTGALIPTIIFPDTTLQFLFENEYQSIELMLPLFGVAMFLASFRTSAHVQVMMNRKDNFNLTVSILAVSLTLGTMIGMSFTQYNYFGIPIAMVIGEFILLVGLGSHLDGLMFFTERFKFILKLLPALFVAIALKSLGGANLTYLLVSITFYVGWSFIFYRKLLFDSSFIVENKE